jgi:hypothetical protein
MSGANVVVPIPAALLNFKAFVKEASHFSDMCISPGAKETGGGQHGPLLLTLRSLRSFLPWTSRFLRRIVQGPTVVRILKVVGNDKKRRGVGKVPNIHNMSLTGAIDVHFSLNFAVVFDFMYFRFRPSKAKSKGNVLTNRQNAANCCPHRE